MLFSGLWRFSIFFILALFFINLISAGTLQISPKEFSFNLTKGETSCQTIKIVSDNMIETIEDRWSLIESKELKDYTKKAKNLGLEIFYNYNIVNDKHEFCVSSNKVGEYYGAILYSSGNLGIGSWIKLEVHGESFGERIQSMGRITGGVIGGRGVYLGLGLWTFILSIILGYLILRLRKRVIFDKHHHDGQRR